MSFGTLGSLCRLFIKFYTFYYWKPCFIAIFKLFIKSKFAFNQSLSSITIKISFLHFKHFILCIKRFLFDFIGGLTSTLQSLVSSEAIHSPKHLPQCGQNNFNFTNCLLTNYEYTAWQFLKFLHLLW